MGEAWWLQIVEVCVLRGVDSLGLPFFCSYRAHVVVVGLGVASLRVPGQGLSSVHEGDRALIYFFRCFRIFTFGRQAPPDVRRASKGGGRYGSGWCPRWVGFLAVVVVGEVVGGARVLTRIFGVVAVVDEGGTPVGCVFFSRVPCFERACFFFVRRPNERVNDDLREGLFNNRVTTGGFVSFSRSNVCAAG